MLEFRIPQGQPGGGGTLEVLATTDSSGQQPAAGTALIFSEVPLVSGSAITHQPGSTDIEINQPGIYQATLYSTVTAAPGTPIPATAQIRLYSNGTPVTGAIAQRTYTASDETGTLAFSIPFRVDTVPTSLIVVSENDGFRFDDLALTVVRLGD